MTDLIGKHISLLNSEVEITPVPHWCPWKIKSLSCNVCVFVAEEVSLKYFGFVVKLCALAFQKVTREQMFPTVQWRQRVEAATLAAGHLPALHLQSRRPPRVSWLPSLVSPSEAQVGPHKTHLHERHRGFTCYEMSWPRFLITTNLVSKSYFI